MFDDSTTVANTGSTAGGYTLIGMSDVTESVTAIALNVKNAIEHANGHNGSITVSTSSFISL